MGNWECKAKAEQKSHPLSVRICCMSLLLHVMLAGRTVLISSIG